MTDNVGPQGPKVEHFCDGAAGAGTKRRHPLPGSGCEAAGTSLEGVHFSFVKGDSVLVSQPPRPE